MSPSRLQATYGKLVPNNLYTNLMGEGLKALLEGMTPYDISRTTEEVILNNPSMSRLIGVTHPFSREADLADSIARVTQGELMDETATIDEMYTLHRSGQLEGGIPTIRARIRNVPPERQESLSNHLQAKIEVDRVFDRSSMQDRDVPSRTWWTLLHSKSAEVRADVYYEEWRRREPEDRRAMERLAQSVQGFWTERFVLRLKRTKNQRGEDQY